jgi:hypothetical protein
VSFDLFRRDQAFHRALDLYVLARILFFCWKKALALEL